MIVHVETGTSFKGAGLYLLHDKREPGETERYTADRIPWTYALNTLEDDPQRVIAEMQQTGLNQSALRIESGHRNTGRPIEKPVMTVALAWSPYQQQPTPEGMIAAAKDYLKDRGWDELQVLMVPHTDEDHAHIHLLINRVHPGTGMAADQGYRNHNAVQWARKHDAREGFFLDRREAKYARGEKIGKDLTRAEWEAWQAAGGTQRPGRKEQVAEMKSGEWDALKAAQRDERKAFFKESGHLRAELREAVRADVKAEFAEPWQDYADHRNRQQQAQKRRDQETRRQITHWRKLGGMESVARLQDRRAAEHVQLHTGLAKIRSGIAAAQAARVKELAEPVLAELAKELAAAYEALKASHRDEKKDLHRDQAAGTPRPDLARRQQDVAGRLTATSSPRPVPVPPPPVPVRMMGRFASMPVPHGIRPSEAVRRHHEQGASSPRPAGPTDRQQPPVGRPKIGPQEFIPQARERADAKGAERGDDGGRGRDR